MVSRLKIMHLIGSVSIGGAQRLVLEMAGHTSKVDYEVHICAFGPVKNETFLVELNSLNLPVIHIQSRKFYNPSVLWKIIKYVRQKKIDLIHTHLTDADIIGRLVSLFTGVPVLGTIHNEPKSFMKLRIDKRVLNKITAKYCTTHLVVVSGCLREQFIAEWAIPDEKISTIYNAVDIDIYLQAPAEHRLQTGDSKFTITNVGRLSKQKAQHILLEAAQMVIAHFPDTQFLFVGQGKLEQDLKNLTHELGLERNVVFMGVRRDVADILASTDIFVLSSLWEGLPLSAIEAMASACATVLTDVGGNRELIEPGKSGLIVPPGDSDALADAIISLLEQEEVRLSIGRAARARVRGKFNLSLMVKQYEEVYKKVLTEAQTRRQL